MVNFFPTTKKCSVLSKKFTILCSKLTASKAICTLVYVLISCTVFFRYHVIVEKCSHLLLLGVLCLWWPDALKNDHRLLFCKVKW